MACLIRIVHYRYLQHKKHGVTTYKEGIKKLLEEKVLPFG